MQVGSVKTVNAAIHIIYLAKCVLLLSTVKLCFRNHILNVGLIAVFVDY